MISDEKLYAALGARLKKLREGDENNSRLTQAELAVKVGLERTSITNIEKGNQKVPLHVLYRLSEVLKVDVATLLPPLNEVKENEEGYVDFVAGNVTAKLPPLASQIAENIFSSYSDKNKE